MKVLMLDDNSGRIESFHSIVHMKGWEFQYAMDAPTCIELMQKEKYDIIFLDHDLDGRTYVPTHEPNTGSEVARWVASDFCNVSLDTFFVFHTLNEKGAKYMEELIKGKGYACIYYPGVWMQNFFSTYAIEQGW